MSTQDNRDEPTTAEPGTLDRPADEPGTLDRPADRGDRDDDRDQDEGDQDQGDYVMTLADGSQERAQSNVATEHNDQPVTATRYAPQDNDD